MAFRLEDIVSGPSNKPPRIIFYGPTKIGKTTVASQAPKTIFLPTEDGEGKLECERFPLMKSYDDVIEAIGSLANGDHEFQTVALDSAEFLESLIHSHCAKVAGKKDFSQFDYGKGFTMADEYWREILDGLDHLRNEKGMAVIILAHSEPFKMEAIETDGYHKHRIGVHKRAASMLEAWVDVLGFASYQVFMKDVDKGFNKKEQRATGQGKRMLYLEERPAFYAGNRFSLPAEIEFSWEAFSQAFENRNQG